MAKQTYKIPTPIDKTYWDIEIPLQTANGIGTRPTSLRVVAFYFAAIMIGFWMITQTFIGAIGIGLQIPFFITYAALVILLGRYTKVKEMRLMQIPVLFNYFPKRARRLLTRRNSDPSGFWKLIGVEKVEELRDGTVRFIFFDGRVGSLYRVVGSASILLFESDRNAILNRVDNFWRKTSPDGEIIELTMKEAQRVGQQVTNLNHQYQELKHEDPDLRDTMEEEFRILKNHVGGSFKSIHQYWLLVGDNIEAFQRLENLVVSEVGQSSLMIKQCTPLSKDAAYESLAPIYRKK